MLQIELVNRELFSHSIAVIIAQWLLFNMHCSVFRKTLRYLGLDLVLEPFRIQKHLYRCLDAMK